MTAQWTNEGVSGLWPALDDPFLSLRGLPDHWVPANETQAVYRGFLQGFDAITGCEVKDLYKFKLFLNKVQSQSEQVPELVLIHLAFVAWVNFEYELSRDLFVEHMQLYPSDVVVIFFLHMLDFCTGKTTRLLTIFPMCDMHLSARNNLYAYYLSIKSFVSCEAQHFKEALELGLKSVMFNPQNIYGIHAVAHALHEVGSWQELASFLVGCKSNWIENSGMRMHIYWHLAIAYERCNEIEKALEAFEQVRGLKESPFAKQDLDAVGFLWRLRLKSSDISYSDTWKGLALLWTGSIFSSTSYFHKIHAALAFSATNQTLLIEKQIAESDGFGMEPIAHAAGMDVLTSILMFTFKRYDESVELLRRSRKHWSLLGGSRAQREVLDLTLKYASLESLRNVNARELA